MVKLLHTRDTHTDHRRPDPPSRPIAPVHLTSIVRGFNERARSRPRPSSPPLLFPSLARTCTRGCYKRVLKELNAGYTTVSRSGQVRAVWHSSKQCTLTSLKIIHLVGRPRAMDCGGGTSDGEEKGRGGKRRRIN